MAIKINGKEYDENKFDDKTKNYVIARQDCSKSGEIGD